MREISEQVEGVDRYVDAGIRLHVVVADPKGEELIDGKPHLRIIRTHRFGGTIDTKINPPAIIGPTQDPRVWYCSEEQEAALLHKDTSKLGQLIYGSEGAGKTRLLGMWHAVMWLRSIGERRMGGQTAPTQQRLEFIREEMFQLYPRSWFRYRAADHQFVMCDGTRIQLISTYRQSKAQGSPLQGFNLSWLGRDEAQDSCDIHADAQSRGRSAKDSMYWQMATATAKDDTEWREIRDVIMASGKWVKRNLSIFRSPFVGAKFLDDTKASLSAREFLRRFGDPITGEVGDLPPELAVYYGWIRKRNATAKPEIATNVTPAVLAGLGSYMRPGARFSILCGHDPGVIYNTTEILQLLMFGNVPTWVVVGELQTKQTTAREHAILLKKKLQDEFYVELDDSTKAAIYIDPHGKGPTATAYGSVYAAFQHEGLDCFNPAPMTKIIQRTARIEMMNRLLGGSMDSPGVSRLVVAEVAGRSVAPKLVEAFESLKKKPGDNDPEGSQAKDVDDKTHAPCAAAYAVWPYEQEAFTAQTTRLALAEAKRRG